MYIQDRLSTIEAFDSIPSLKCRTEWACNLLLLLLLLLLFLHKYCIAMFLKQTGAEEPQSEG